MAPSGSRWLDLRKSLGERLLTPDDDGYASLAPSAISRFDGLQPQAIARPHTAIEVVDCLAAARRDGGAFAVRGGGHCGAGSSSTTGLLIDMSLMKAVSATASSHVAVGAGVLTEALVKQLASAGLTLPVGTCPGVGIAGLTLGGGIGPLGRLEGFTADQLVGAEVVLADGAVVRCDEEIHGDLFWALRGGGCGSLGVVTKLVFRACSLPPCATLVHSEITAPNAVDRLLMWQELAVCGSRSLSLELTLEAQGADRRGEILGLYVGDAAPAAVDLCGHAACAQLTEMSWLAVLEQLAASSATGAETAIGSARQGYRIAKSDLFDRPLPRATLEHLADAWRTEAPPFLASIEFAPLGGAYSRRASGALAVPHRTAAFSILFSAIVPGASAEEIALARTWVSRMRSITQAEASGAIYQNFRDPDLDAWDRAYFGANAARLAAVKARYDPEALFTVHGGRLT